MNPIDVFVIDISGERIWTELKKILGGSFVGSIVRVMLELGLAKYVGKWNRTTAKYRCQEVPITAAERVYFDKYVLF